jgi:hypothetical protein
MWWSPLIAPLLALLASVPMAAAPTVGRRLPPLALLASVPIIAAAPTLRRQLPPLPERDATAPTGEGLGAARTHPAALPAGPLDPAAVDYAAQHSGRASSRSAAEPHASTPAPSGLQVIVPEGLDPGAQLFVNAPDGQHLQVTVPPGTQPGQTILVHLPPPVITHTEPIASTASPPPPLPPPVPPAPPLPLPASGFPEVPPLPPPPSPMLPPSPVLPPALAPAKSNCRDVESGPAWDAAVEKASTLGVSAPSCAQLQPYCSMADESFDTLRAACALTCNTCPPAPPKQPSVAILNKDLSQITYAHRHRHRSSSSSSRR